MITAEQKLRQERFMAAASKADALKLTLELAAGGVTLPLGLRYSDWKKIDRELRELNSAVHGACCVVQE